MSAHGSISGVLEWAVAGHALAGEEVSGDLHCVVPVQSGALVGVVDGVGHGPEAAAAARAAIDTMTASAGLGLTTIMRGCHEALLRLRGAVMSLALFDSARSSVSWTGVGNVEGVLLKRGLARRRERLLVRGGVVGQSMPPQYVATVPVDAGDMLVLATDGLRSTFADDLVLRQDARTMADEILRCSSTGRDDALVLVALYTGER